MSTELVAAVRHANVPRALELIAAGTDVNTVCATAVRHVAPAGTPTQYTPYDHEGPLYDTFPLFEAARSGHDELIDALLASDATDVNVVATKVHITTLADAAARGDVALVVKLLNHPRIDHHAGSADVPTPLLYACRYGHEAAVAEFLDRGLAEFDEEAGLKEEAATNGNPEIIRRVHNYFLTKRTLEEMGPGEQLERLRFEFERADINHNNSLDKAELMAVAEALGRPLGDEEAAEALVAMDTNSDGRVEVDELAAFWLPAVVTSGVE